METKQTTEERETAIVTIGQNQAMTSSEITPANLEARVKQAEALASFHARIRPIAFKATHNNDWVILGDRPYLLESGVKKILNILGASVSEIKVVREAIEDPVSHRIDYYYTASGRLDFNGRVVEENGVSSTRDDFFAAHWVEQEVEGPNGKEKKKIKVLKTVDQIDLPDVQKKSVTNLYHRLLNSAFSISPSMEDLTEYKITPTSKVKYGAGAQGGSVDSQDEKNMRAEIRECVLKITGGDEAAARLCLMELTAFGTGPEAFKGYGSVDKVSLKMLKATVTKAKAKLAEMTAMEAK